MCPDYCTSVCPDLTQLRCALLHFIFIIIHQGVLVPLSPHLCVFFIVNAGCSKLVTIEFGQCGLEPQRGAADCPAHSVASFSPCFTDALCYGAAGFFVIFSFYSIFFSRFCSMLSLLYLLCRNDSAPCGLLRWSSRPPCYLRPRVQLRQAGRK